MITQTRILLKTCVFTNQTWFLTNVNNEAERVLINCYDTVCRACKYPNSFLFSDGFSELSLKTSKRKLDTSAPF